MAWHGSAAWRLRHPSFAAGPPGVGWKDGREEPRTSAPPSKLQVSLLSTANSELTTSHHSPVSRFPSRRRPATRRDATRCSQRRTRTTTSSFCPTPLRASEPINARRATFTAGPARLAASRTPFKTLLSLFTQKLPSSRKGLTFNFVSRANCQREQVSIPPPLHLLRPASTAPSL